MIDISTHNSGNDLAAGTYDVYLFGDAGYTQQMAKTTITVVAGSVATDKTAYGYGEDIVITAEASSALTSAGAWVGLYKSTDTPGADTPSLAYYYVSDFAGRAVVLQDLVTSSSVTGLTAPLEAGNYKVCLFADSGYSNIADTAEITVSANVSAKFTNGAYEVDNLSDGFANGTVALELADGSFGYMGGGDVALYWADAEGKPLSGYTALAKNKIKNTLTTFDLYTHTIIPEGAEALVAYVSYDGTEGSEGYVIELPEGTATYSFGDGDYTEFQMVSDLHVTSELSETVDGGTLIDQYYHVNDNAHFEMMLEDIAENSPESIGIFVNGDIANNGLKVEFDQTASIYNSVAEAKGTLPAMYVSLGNHDSYLGNIDAFVDYANSLLGEDEQITVAAPYYSKDINGTKFIFLSGDNSDYYGLYSANPNSNDAELSDAQLAWLDSELAENEANGGKPVFVMLHQAIQNTVAGSFEGQDWDGVVNIDEFKAVLNKYNNVILLGGHSHWEINSPNNMYAGSADLPVAINTASVGYLWSDYSGAEGGEWIEGSQGFYVRAYEDKTVFLGRDFENQKWIPSACYVIYNEDVNASSVTLDVDSSLAASDYLSNPNGRTVTFATSDKNIVQVASDGTITGVALGSATVTVTAAATDTEVVTREKSTLPLQTTRFPTKLKQCLATPLTLATISAHTSATLKTARKATLQSPATALPLTETPRASLPPRASGL